MTPLRAYASKVQAFAALATNREPPPIATRNRSGDLFGVRTPDGGLTSAERDFTTCSCLEVCPAVTGSRPPRPPG
jgi:hypothetical protein